jgi:hypothetical protein
MYERQEISQLALLDQLNDSVEDLSAAIQQEAEKRPEARLLIHILGSAR